MVERPGGDGDEDTVVRRGPRRLPRQRAVPTGGPNGHDLVVIEPGGEDGDEVVVGAELA